MLSDSAWDLVHEICSGVIGMDVTWQHILWVVAFPPTAVPGQVGAEGHRLPDQKQIQVALDEKRQLDILASFRLR